MEESAVCEWYASNLLIVSDNVGPFIYYTHLLPLIASLLLGVFVFWTNRRSIVHWVLLFMTLMFSTWVYFDLILWASPSPEAVMFFWSSIVPIEMLIYASGLYLVLLFCNNQEDVSLTTKLKIAAFFIPIVLFTHTGYNVLGLSPDCDVGAIDCPLIQYMYFVEIIFIVWAAIAATRAYQRLTIPRQRQQLRAIAFGTVVFLLTFTAGNITLIFSAGPLYEQYKLFGMPIFVAFVTYSIVRFQTFNAKIFTAQALILALGILVFSLLALDSLETVRIVTMATFALVCLLGYNLIRSVRVEIEQRQLIEIQEKELEVINKKQEGLLHFISHEVKGYLTKSQGAFAGIVQGDYGPATAQLKKMAQGGLSDMRRGADMVADILEASNLQKGTVSYDKKEFDFKESVNQAVRDLTPFAAKKGLYLTFTPQSGPCTVEGDEPKIRRHVVRNLIDNALRYTQQGGITVTLTSEPTHVTFMVTDTGVGITDEDKQRLFTEGGKGKDSIKINVDSTGYGLFISKQIVEAHGGTIRAESDGPGKGSRFIVELPKSAQKTS